MEREPKIERGGGGREEEKKEKKRLRTKAGILKNPLASEQGVWLAGLVEHY